MGGASIIIRLRLINSGSTMETQDKNLTPFQSNYSTINKQMFKSKKQIVSIYYQKKIVRISMQNIQVVVG